MWTKQQLIELALGEIGLGTAFNVGPDELEDALKRLDSMMATWNGKGIRLGYALPSTPDASELDQDSGLADTAHEAVFMNLAVRLAGGFGKTLSQDTRNTARDAYEGLLAVAAYPPQQQLPNTLPRGAGNKPWRGQSPYMPTPTDPLLAGDDPITV